MIWQPIAGLPLRHFGVNFLLRNKFITLPSFIKDILLFGVLIQDAFFAVLWGRWCSSASITFSVGSPPAARGNAAETRSPRWNVMIARLLDRVCVLISLLRLSGGFAWIPQSNCSIKIQSPGTHLTVFYCNDFFFMVKLCVARWNHLV